MRRGEGVTDLLRVAVVGATGSVGREVLSLLEARRFPMQELVPVATERSLGASVEVLGHELPVATDARLEGLDLAFVATPGAAALDWVRRSLEARVPVLDLSGAAASTPDVPVLAAALTPDKADLEGPVLGCPGGAALAWALVLAPIARAAGLVRVVGTGVESVSGAGRGGIEVLESETRALFNQVEPPDSEFFHHGVAFDCVPATEPPEHEGETAAERALRRELARLLGGEQPVAVAATLLRTATFAGAGASLAIETERPLTPAACAALLADAPGVDVWDDDAPSTRDAVGSDEVRVARVRNDPSRPQGLLLWLASDPICLAAHNAVRLAEARFSQG